MKPTVFFLVSLFMLAGCSSRSVMPDVKEVKVSREAPPANCKELGELTGRTATAKGTQQEALEDLKHETANKGGNYVVVKQYSTYGTAVTGLAYECP